MPPPSLETIVEPALASLRREWLRYLREKTLDAAEVAADIARNPFRVSGMAESDLAQARLMTVRATKVGKGLELCALQLASHHEGTTLDRSAPGCIILERTHDRIVIRCQSRETSENYSNQKSRTQELLLAQRAHAKRTHLARFFVAESGTDQEYSIDKDGVHNVRGRLAFHWLSADPECWAKLGTAINTLMRAKDIRQAEFRYRTAVEGMLIDHEGEEMPPEVYERSRYRLEEVLGNCAPVLCEQPRAEPPPDIWALFEELNQAS